MKKSVIISDTFRRTDHENHDTLIRMARYIICFLLVLFPSIVVARGAGEAPAGTHIPAELEFWHVCGMLETETRGAIESIVDGFNTSQDRVSISTRIMPWDGWYQLFLTAVVSQNAPDISTGAFPQPIQFAKMGEILHLDSIIREWEAQRPDILKDFFPGSIELYQYDDHQVGMPWFIDPRVIYYRKDIFAQAGIERLPEYWDEFIETCRTIKRKTGVTPFLIGAGDHFATHVMLHFLLGTGGGLTDPDGMPHNDPSFYRQVLEFAKQLYDEQLISHDVTGIRSSVATEQFIQGRGAMIFSGMIVEWSESDPAFGRSGILPTMRGPTGIKQGLTWIGPIMAYSQTEYPDEAKHFIRRWVETNLALWTEGMQATFPIRQSYRDHAFFIDDPLGRYVIEEIFPYAVLPTWPAVNLYEEFDEIEGENILGKALIRLIQEDGDPAEIAEELAESIAAKFDR